MSGHSRRTSTRLRPPRGPAGCSATGASGPAAGGRGRRRLGDDGWRLRRRGLLRRPGIGGGGGGPSSRAGEAGTPVGATGIGGGGTGSSPRGALRRRRRCCLGCGFGRGLGSRLGGGGGRGLRRSGRCAGRRRGRGRGGRSGRSGGSGGRRGAGHVHPALEPLEAGHHAVGGVVGARQQHARAEQLEQQARRGRAAHLGEAGGHDVGGPAELDRTEARGLGHEALAGVLRDVDQPGRGGVGHRSDDDEVAQPAQQVLGEAARVLTGLDDLVDHREDGRTVTGGERLDDLVEERVGREAEQVGRHLVGHPARTGATEQLVEHGERVTRRPGAGTHDERQGGGLDRHALLAGELGQVVAEQPRRDQPEGVVVGARADGRQHLVGLGRGEDEPQVGRRLLDQLEQGVEALRGDHVGLVDDVDLVAVAHRGEERLLPEVAGIVHTTVGRRVDLDDVDGARAAAREVAAAVALAAGIGDRGLRAVERAGEDAGRGGLAAAARAGEEVGVVDAVGRQRRSQRLGHVVLPDDLLEGLGPVAAIERER